MSHTTTQLNPVGTTSRPHNILAVLEEGTRNYWVPDRSGRDTTALILYARQPSRISAPSRAGSFQCCHWHHWYLQLRVVADPSGVLHTLMYRWRLQLAAS